LTTNTYIIREIKPDDNPQIAKTIREVLIEFGVPKVGTAYEDEALDYMYKTYNKPKSTYFVVIMNNKIVGGAGIMQLQNSEDSICELQKMYFSPEARGKGIGAKMMKTCLKKASEFEFKKCYLETLPYMKGARKLYHKVGFKSLDSPLGNTGHFSCNMWMIKDLI
jgi:putative acetyltransferase